MRGLGGLTETFNDQAFHQCRVGERAGEGSHAGIRIQQTGDWQFACPVVNRGDELFCDWRVDLPECLGGDFVFDVVEPFVEP